MKATVDPPAPLLRAAGTPAKREGGTLRRASVKGKGLRPELRNAWWDRSRDPSHDERAGLTVT
jgi:hypothetical protein